jgi:hypothetical protein
VGEQRCDPLAADPASDGRLRLRAWQVPVVSVEPASALSLLDEIAETIKDCRPAASIRYLGAVLALARDLVDRGRVLPSLVDGPAARWRPELSGVDSARFTALRDAMPPVCRAEWLAQSPEGRGPSAVLRSALDALVDGVVRARLSAADQPARLTTLRRGRLATSGKPDALLDQLDPLPITLRRHHVVDLLRPAYQVMAGPRRGLSGH